MKKNKLFIGIGLIFMVFIINIWKNYIPESNLIGKYVNNNTEFILEGPSPIQNGRDTLVLLANGTFKNKTWGSGTYKISNSFMTTDIDFSYTSSMGKAGYSTQIEKSLLGKIKIILDYDMGFHLKKIN